MFTFRLIILSIFSFLAGNLMAQDSIAVQRDTTARVLKAVPQTDPPVVKSAERLRLEKMPRTAAFRSAIIPGWGQITNKRWWKVPLVYGGFVGIALVYDFNQTNYKIFLEEAQIRDFNTRNPNNLMPGNPQYQRLSNTGIISIKDGYRRNRDLTILGGLAFYTITIVDAYVDAKFFRFDITDDLALRVSPALQRQAGQNSFGHSIPSVKMVLSISK